MEIVLKTLAFRLCSTGKQPYLLLLHNEREPDAAEWHAYVRTVRATLATADRRIHAFIATDGGGPNAPQRKELAQVVSEGQADMLSHIFTRDPFVRGIVTAFRWISGARAVAHLPNAFVRVCEESGHSPAEVLREFERMQEEFARVDVLQRISEAA